MNDSRKCSLQCSIPVHPAAGRWTEAPSAVTCEVTLNGQEPGVELEYRVIAFNRLGDGPPSNLVKAVL
jgi:hypothetical protein